MKYREVTYKPSLQREGAVEADSGPFSLAGTPWSQNMGKKRGEHSGSPLHCFPQPPVMLQAVSWRYSMGSRSGRAQISPRTS